MGNLDTWRLPFSADVKRRRQQKLADRRAGRRRVPAARPNATLGTPDVHWSSPPSERAYKPKGSDVLPGASPVLDHPARPRKRRRSRRA